MLTSTTRVNFLVVGGADDAVADASALGVT